MKDICTPYNVKIPKTPPFDLSKVAIGKSSSAPATRVSSPLIVSLVQLETEIAPRRVLCSVLSCMNNTTLALPYLVVSPVKMSSSKVNCSCDRNIRVNSDGSFLRSQEWLGIKSWNGLTSIPRSKPLV